MRIKNAISAASVKYDKFIERINGLSSGRMFFVIMLIYAGITVFRIIQGNYERYITIYGDEMLYKQFALSLFDGRGLYVQNMPMTFTPVLYPISIMICGIFEDGFIQNSVINILNSVYITSAVLPGYLLAKKMLKNNVYSIFFTFLIGFTPFMAYSHTFMSEVLFIPVSAWVFYFVYSFLCETDYKKKFILAFASGLSVYICSIVKESSTFLLISAILLFSVYIIFKNNRLKNILCLIIFSATYFILRYTVQYVTSLFSNNFRFSSYSVHNLDSLFQPERIVFIMYACVVYFIAAVLSFYVLPVLIPLFSFKSFSKADKNLFIFTAVCLVSAIGMTAVAILVNEQYGIESMRYHGRYFDVLFIPFALLTVKAVTNREKPEKSANKSIVVVTASYLMLFLTCFTFTGMGTIDNAFLPYYVRIVKRLEIGLFNYANGLQINSVEIAFRIGVIIAVTLFLFLLYGTKHKNSRKVTGIILVSLFIVNTANANFTEKAYTDMNRVNDYSRLYDVQVKNINDYLQGAEGNVLVISDNFDIHINTYLTIPFFYTTPDIIKSTISEKGEINLNETTLASNFSNFQLTDLKTADYIVCINGLSFADCEEINLDGLQSYHVYKNTNPGVIKIDMDSIFPLSAGEIKEWAYDSDSFSTNHLTADGKFVSEDREEKEPLLSSGYETVTKGRYKITIHVNYTGGLSGTLLGFAEAASGTPLGYKEFFPADNIIELDNIVIENKIDNVRVRLLVDRAGVVVEKITVEKYE